MRSAAPRSFGGEAVLSEEPISRRLAAILAADF